MSKNRIVTLGNLSNEANMHASRETKLLQLNTVIFAGLDSLRANRYLRRKLPLSVALDKSGALEISGIEGISLSDDRIRIHSDRKVTTSSDSNLPQSD
jgi:hypothetical protein